MAVVSLWPKNVFTQILQSLYNFISILDTIAPSLIAFEQNNDNIFLIHDLESNEKRLHVTKNFGETYSVVQDYVRNFFFQYNSGQTQLYIERIQPTTRYVFK